MAVGSQNAVLTVHVLGYKCAQTRTRGRTELFEYIYFYIHPHTVRRKAAGANCICISGFRNAIIQ